MSAGRRICRHEGVCGGCGLQATPYPEQLTEKGARLRALLPASAFPRGAAGPLFLPVFPLDLAAGPWHYRQKVAFVFGPAADGRGLVMGHYARGSQRLVAVDECPVHSERGNRIAFALRDRLAAARISAAGPSLNGIVRHLLIRTTADDREAVAMLVVTRNDKSLRKPVRALLESDLRPDGFYVNIHDTPGPFMVGRETLKIDGRGQIRERVGGLSFLVSPTAFFQTNVRAAAVLQAHVLEAVRSSPRVLDLYAGSGLFSLALLKAGAQVMAIEENRQAVEDAEANLRLNRLPPNGIRLLAARVDAVLDRIANERWDAVVLDPPRQGCAPAVLEAVFGRIRPPRAVYVSCNPEALAAELPRIVSSGYVVSDLRAVDMFPHTDHIETVVTLVRRQK